MAKAVGGGLPIGLTITKNSLGDVPEGAHSNTYGGNLVAVAAANELVKYVKKNREQLEQQTKRKGKYMIDRLNQMKDRYEIMGDVRGLGLMIGIEFVKDKKSKTPAPQERDDVIVEAFNDGLLMLPCGPSTLRIIPPLTIDQKNIEEGLEVLESAIRKVNGKR